MPRHKTRTSFVKGDKRLKGIPKSEEFKKHLSKLYRKRVVVKCDNCKKKIEIIPSRLKNLKHYFCDRKCYKEYTIKTDWYNKRKFNFTKEGRQKTIDGFIKWAKKNWKKKSKEEKLVWIKKMAEGNRKTKITKPELRILNIINKYNLKYSYTGDGYCWIKNINPDFVNYKKRIIIEVFGDYWHSRFKTRIKDIVKFFRLKFLGWNRIVLWEKHINNSTDKDIYDHINLYEYYYGRKYLCHLKMNIQVV